MLTKIMFFFSSSDMWGLGCLVWESYNGPLRSRTNLKDIENVCQIKINKRKISLKQ